MPEAPSRPSHAATSASPLASADPTLVAYSSSSHHVLAMCGRVIQSSAPIRDGVVDGMNVRIAASTIIRPGRISL
jgi:hypothetical protein